MSPYILQCASGNHHDHVATASHAERLVKASKVPYIQGKQTRISGGTLPNSSVMITVCHPNLVYSQAVMKDWKLGSLRPGEEFLAVVSQPRT